MKTSINCLPQDLENRACSAFIGTTPLTSWLPVLSYLQKEFQLEDASWEKIPQGANALFKLGSELIVKLVPPNWRRQGDKEILVIPLLDSQLSLTTPRLIGSGEIDNWVFIISDQLDGTLLADIWPLLDIEQKRLIMLQTGEILRELRAIKFEPHIAIQVDWTSYIRNLISECVGRHKRNQMPANLLSQVMPFIEASGNFAQPTEARFIHMDIHPWNLMAKQENGCWRLDGLFDFGDAIVGNSDRFELLTPMIFMAQGNPLLLTSLLDSYGTIDELGAIPLQRQLMANMLIRPDSDVMFCMKQIPINGPRETWEQIAAQLFPL